MDRYKKMLRTAAASALVLTLATGTAFAALGTATVTQGPLRMRAEASTESEILLKASEGASVEVLEDAGNGWYQVSYKGATGYMSAEYLSMVPTLRALDAEAVPASEAPADAGGEEVCALVTVSSTLNVRSGPGTGYDKVGSLGSGEIVTVLSQEDEWSQVSSGSVTGYVSNEYLTFGSREELAAMASAAGARIVEIAKQYLGVPYRYGGASPSGFDCSGFVYWVFAKHGVTVPRDSVRQSRAGQEVAKADLMPGDIIIFRIANTPNGRHSAIYIGDGSFIHSPSAGSRVRVERLDADYWKRHYLTARRVLEEPPCDLDLYADPGVADTQAMIEAITDVDL